MWLLTKTKTRKLMKKQILRWLGLDVLKTDMILLQQENGFLLKKVNMLQDELDFRGGTTAKEDGLKEAVIMLYRKLGLQLRAKYLEELADVQTMRTKRVPYLVKVKAEKLGEPMPNKQ